MPVNKNLSRKFFLIEGVGGSGKSTIAKSVTRKLRKDGFGVVLTREPGGVRAAETIRELVFDFKRERVVGGEGQAALFFAARKIWIEQKVKPALAKGKIVIADRSYPSTMAYQGYAEGGDKRAITKMVKIVMGDCLPHTIFFLDLPAKLAFTRNAKAKGNDPFDDEGIAYHQKLVGAYRNLAKRNWTTKWHRVDATKPAGEVASSVYQKLIKLL